TLLTGCVFFLLPLLSLLFAHMLIGILRENFLAARHGKGAGCANNLSHHRLLWSTFIVYIKNVDLATFRRPKIYMIAHLCIIRDFYRQFKRCKKLFKAKKQAKDTTSKQAAYKATCCLSIIFLFTRQSL